MVNMSSSKHKQPQSTPSDRGRSGGRSGGAGGPQRPVDDNGPTPFSRRHPVLRAVVIFGVLMGGYYLLEYRFMLKGDLLEPYLSFIASASARLLSLLGHETTSQGRWLASTMFSVQIIHGCDALEPTAAYLSAVLASPVAFRSKVPGIVIGLICLLTLNLVRIVSLFLIWAHFPKVMDAMHYEIWQAVFIVLAIVFWAIWVQWATRDKQKHARTEE